MRFWKYHALGNSYLVVPTWSNDGVPTPAEVVRLCDMRLGIGSDGILLGPLHSDLANFRLRIFNPDGSEAEKSGNGLRIFCRYLWDMALVDAAPFNVETVGGIVTAQVLSAERIRVSMGTISFANACVPVVGHSREVLLEEISVADTTFKFCAASIGNPHCVIPVQHALETQARAFGPLLEHHPLFPNRTNVQFMEVIDRNNIRIEIWERGAGYTFASGSSSCAAAAVAYKLGLCEPNITVHMRGGSIQIRIDPQFNVIMTGSATPICCGELKQAFTDTV